MSLEIKRIRALCFDIDGTLCDTDDMWVHRIENLIRPVGAFLPGKETHPFARRFVMGIETPGNLAYHLLDRLGLDDEVAWLFNKMSKLRERRPRRKFWIIPRVEETLLTLKQHFPLSVVSARGEVGTLAFLEQYSLHGFFRSVVTAQTCLYTKPYPHPIQKAAEEMGVRPEECLMIGDTTVDIRAGRAAGAQTAGLLCGFGQEEELRRAGADIILPTPFDLIRVLLDQTHS